MENLATSDIKFESAYRDFELQNVCYLPFGCFLLKPMQRVVHYKILIESKFLEMLDIITLISSFSFLFTLLFSWAFFFIFFFELFPVFNNAVRVSSILDVDAPAVKCRETETCFKCLFIIQTCLILTATLIEVSFTKQWSKSIFSLAPSSHDSNELIISRSWHNCDVTWSEQITCLTTTGFVIQFLILFHIFLILLFQEFIREGSLYKLSRKGFEQRLFFLFSDCVFYSSKGVTETNQFKVHAQLPLKNMIVSIMFLFDDTFNLEWVCFTWILQAVSYQSAISFLLLL